jgi:hypothetical protein
MNAARQAIIAGAGPAVPSRLDSRIAPLDD